MNVMGVESREGEEKGSEGRGSEQRAGKPFGAGTSREGRVWILSSLLFSRVHPTCTHK